jgi:Tfp pilus assembly protein PilZ
VATLLHVQYRNSNAFLVAYAVHISRGGLFLETEMTAIPGTEVTLRLEIDRVAQVDLPARIVWQRSSNEGDGGLAGVAVEIDPGGIALGGLVDRLVAELASKEHPLRVLVIGGTIEDKRATRRIVGTTVATAELVTYAAESELIGDFDLAVVDLRGDSDAALTALAAAQRARSQVPTVVLLADVALAERANELGASETLLASSPPTELRRAILRTLARPRSVKTSHSS